MAFRNVVTTLSELIADSVIGAAIQTDSVAPFIKMWKDTFGRNRLDFEVSGSSRWQEGTISAAGGVAGGFGTQSLTLQSPYDNQPGSGAQDVASFALLAGDQTAAPLLGTRPRLDANLLEALFKTLRTLSTAQFDGGVIIGGDSTGSNKISHVDFGKFAATNTNANGRIGVNHQLGNGHVVTGVMWTDIAGNHPYVGRHVNSLDTDTAFTIEFRRSDTDAIAPAGVSMGGSWIAFA